MSGILSRKCKQCGQITDPSVDHRRWVHDRCYPKYQEQRLREYQRRKERMNIDISASMRQNRETVETFKETKNDTQETSQKIRRKVGERVIAGDKITEKYVEEEIYSESRSQHQTVREARREVIERLEKEHKLRIEKHTRMVSICLDSLKSLPLRRQVAGNYMDYAQKRLNTKLGEKLLKAKSYEEWIPHIDDVGDVRDEEDNVLLSFETLLQYRMLLTDYLSDFEMPTIKELDETRTKIPTYLTLKHVGCGHCLNCQKDLPPDRCLTDKTVNMARVYFDHPKLDHLPFNMHFPVFFRYKPYEDTYESLSKVKFREEFEQNRKSLMNFLDEYDSEDDIENVMQSAY